MKDSINFAGKLLKIGDIEEFYFYPDGDEGDYYVCKARLTSYISNDNTSWEGVGIMKKIKKEDSK